MQALILAAGRGSRMGRLTANHPKCMTRLCGKTLIEWQFDALRAAGIGEIAVVRGYSAEGLEAPTHNFFDNRRWAETNMVMSLVSARKWLQADTTIVSYSDIVYGPQVVKRLLRANGAIAVSYDRQWLSLWSARFDDPLSDAESFVVGPDGKLAGIGRRCNSLDSIDGQYMGLLKFTPSGWHRVSTILERLAPHERDRLDMTSLLQILLDSGIDIDLAPIDGGWCEVDSESDLDLYERIARQAENWPHDWRGPQ